MSQISVQMTRFQLEKLQRAGGSGGAAPYRVSTYQSMGLGAFGTVMEVNLEAANSAGHGHKLGGLVLHGLRRLMGAV